MSQTVLLSWLLFAAHVLIVLLAAVLISTNRKPSAAIAWILAIIFIPVLGILFFWFRQATPQATREAA
jgi:cardiolipin synthase A/B